MLSVLVEFSIQLSLVLSKTNVGDLILYDKQSAMAKRDLYEVILILTSVCFIQICFIFRSARSLNISDCIDSIANSQRCREDPDFQMLVRKEALLELHEHFCNNAEGSTPFITVKIIITNKMACAINACADSLSMYKL